MPQYPPIQVVDENDKPLRGATLDEVHLQGLVHRAVLIFVEDAEGTLLVQKRGPNVATYPGKWDFSAAGHVDEGEDYLSAAKRELKEELGLEGYELQEIGSKRVRTLVGERILDRFLRVYRVIIPVDTVIKIQESEVAEVQWFRVADIKQLAIDEPDAVHPDLGSFLDTYYP
jgi:isopentenyldiphosphate isomerase